MEKLGLNEIREKFLSFYETKAHLRLPSFSLVPQNDASLLLINAGMAPLKPYFTGKEVPPRKRVTTCQKCIRTPDIERVGKTARHGTFFEMLGNFSFGDYFKREAIAWAWEFITKELEMPVDKLWVTVYQDDDEAEEIWIKEIGVSPDHVVRMGKEDNFWEIGTGPCGPCSEIYFDRGVEAGCGSPDCKLGCDCDRFVEFWNLVFTQFDKDEDGNYNRLAHPNIDTGMGLERLAAIMQGVNNLFEVDTVRNIMLAISDVAGVKYGENEKSDVSLRVITDHIRSTTFMVSDNIVPSNEGRGYVVRRLLRRAARHGKLLGIKKPFLYKIAETVIRESGAAYPELREKQELICKIIRREEEQFDNTIDQGLAILNGFIAELREKGEKVLSGEKTFKLYDTFGFPIDLTVEILAEKGLEVDEEGFKAEMELQKKRARDARKEGEGAGWSEDVYTKLDKSITTEFKGYTEKTVEGKVLALIAEGAVCDAIGEGEDGAVILDKTVIYGESGGQVGDCGSLTNANIKAIVKDAKKLADGKIVHFIHMEKGVLSLGDTVESAFCRKTRRATMQNHSATHLLQKALREVVGDHVTQAGSFVNAQRLRFDFNHFEAVTPDQLREVEKKVNEAILSALPVEKLEMAQDDAKKLGAMALFGEKYGDVVRVVKMGDYSMELCGGTHVDNTSEIGLFKLLSESSVAAGVRRIEGITGMEILSLLAEKEALIAETAQALKTSPADISAKAAQALEEVKNLQKELESVKLKNASGQIDSLLASGVDVDGIKVVTGKFDGLGADEMRAIGDKVRDKIGSGALVLAGTMEGKVTFIAMATKDAIARGVHAGNLVREVAKVAGGGGGGKPDSAQAGGKMPEKADEALAVVAETVKTQLK
ncbi:MAG: alanine--tRNA ligase [Clostridia bacterium]|nr:alanine--tRNA ligase [Clostridia bacterium]